MGHLQVAAPRNLPRRLLSQLLQLHHLPRLQRRQPQRPVPMGTKSPTMNLKPCWTSYTAKANLPVPPVKNQQMRHLKPPQPQRHLLLLQPRLRPPQRRQQPMVVMKMKFPMMNLKRC